MCWLVNQEQPLVYLLCGSCGSGATVHSQEDHWGPAALQLLLPLLPFVLDWAAKQGGLQCTHVCLILVTSEGWSPWIQCLMLYLCNATCACCLPFTRLGIHAAVSTGHVSLLA
jgi:hypothetical protein